jgi:RNA polymerase sigma factor (sigma-70 family)
MAIETLHEHADWLRRLARHLAGDGDSDDLIQETWMAAWRVPPDPERRARPWLAQVLRNLIHVRRRNRARRVQREQDYQATLVDRTAAVDEVYERVDLQRFVAEQVMALEEPLRTVVILRYFEGLDSPRIAKLTGAAPGTVRWRLKLALDQLRAGLDARHGGQRRAWVAILGLADRSPVKAATAGPVPTSGPLSSAAQPWPLLAVGLALTAAVVALVISGAMAGRGSSASPGKYRAEIQAAPSRLSSPPALLPVVERAIAAGVIEGRVMDAAGRPVEGATVLAEPQVGDFGSLLGFSANPPPASTSARADGRFRLVSLPAGRHLLSASRAGLGFATPGIVRLAPGEAHAGVVLRLRASVGLAGRVTDSGGGAVSGALVRARHIDHFPQSTFAAVSDAEGRYGLEVPPGRYVIVAEADGYAQRERDDYVRVRLVRDFQLDPASRLSGRVVAGTDGAALVGAEVFALNHDSPEGRGVVRAVTGEGGAFQFTDLDPGSHRLVARHGSLVGQRPKSVVLGVEQQVSGLELALHPGRRATGTVRTAEGRPLPGAQVMALTEAMAFTSTDAGGRYVLAGLPAQSFELAASAPGYQSARVPIALASGNPEPVDFRLSPEAALSGTVLDENRRPVAGVQVTATAGGDPLAHRGVLGRATQSDGEGRFRIDRLAAAPLTLAFSHAAGVADWGPFPMAAGENRTIEVVLGAGAQVAGTVRREDGHPASGAVVYAQHQNRGPIRADAALVGTDGRYQLAGLHPGDTLIYVEEAGHRALGAVVSRAPRPDRIRLALRSGDRHTDLDLTILRSDLRISGQVRDAQGRPVAGAVLRTGPSGAARDPFYARASSNEDGRFNVDRLGPGPHTISVWHPDLAPQRREGVLAGTGDLQLNLDRAGSLAGRVVGADGRARTNYWIIARPTIASDVSEWARWRHWNGGERRQRVLSPDGAFLFTQLVPGTYDLHAYSPDRQVAALRATASSGERTGGLQLILQRQVQIKGRVVDHTSGRPVSGARVEARGTAAGLVAAEADAGGAFSLDGLPAGEPVGFTVLAPGGDYLTDSQHRTTPAAGGAIDIGEVPLYRGPRATLSNAGAGAAGLSIHTREGRPFLFVVSAQGPAAQAGARPGDLVLSVDGGDVRRLGGSVAEGLLGAAGRTVRLTVQTPGQAPREIVVVKPQL